MQHSDVNFLEIDEHSKTIIPYSINEGRKFNTVVPGLYKTLLHPMGGLSYITAFEPIVDRESLIEFENGVVGDIVNKADKFFSEECTSCFKDLKLCHKMGMLLYGSPGTGKTSTAYLAMKKLVTKYSAVALDCTGVEIGHIRRAIKIIRKVQDSPIVVFVDEFEHRINCGEENSWLTFLDGGDSVGNTIFLGCTNYVDKIPDRIKNRKSRIKHSFSVEVLPEDVYKKYITEKLPKLNTGDLAKFSYIAAEKKLVIDQLKNAIIDYAVDKVSIEDAIAEAAKGDFVPIKPEEDDDDDNEL